MSSLKPVAKQPRLMKKLAPSPLTRAATVDQSKVAQQPEDVEEKNRRIGTLPLRPAPDSATLTMNVPNQKKPRHPKGHIVRDLDETWQSMNGKTEFLNLSDTIKLNDVWVQPMTVLSSKGTVAEVIFQEIVIAPHVKHREHTCKISLDDLGRMLYLTDCLQWDIARVERSSFDDWVAAKENKCIEMKGVDEANDRGKLCEFIMKEDQDFSFYPLALNNSCGIFFRKICYHSYKDRSGAIKLDNPSMMKCVAAKGFEYVLEARLLVLPQNWIETVYPESSMETEEAPASQAY